MEQPRPVQTSYLPQLMAAQNVERYQHICATFVVERIMSRINAAPTRFSAPREIRTTGKDARRPQSEGTTQGTLREVLSIAEERGLLAGSRTHVLRGRMPVGLVQQAKLKSGISSDSKLLEAALANLAVSDDYAQWLLEQRGTVNPELDLEF
jgi:hypothetical protein